MRRLNTCPDARPPGRRKAQHPIQHSRVLAPIDPASRASRVAEDGSTAGMQAGHAKSHGHAFFASLDWEALRAQTLPAPPPPALELGRAASRDSSPRSEPADEPSPVAAEGATESEALDPLSAKLMEFLKAKQQAPPPTTTTDAYTT